MEFDMKNEPLSSDPLGDLRLDLAEVPADARDRMRHRVLNATRHPAQTNASRRFVSRRALLLNAAVAVAVVGTVGAVVVPMALRSGGSGSTPPVNEALGTATPPPTPLNLLDVAYVKTQTMRALADASNSVVHIHDAYFGGGYHDEWSDKATGRRRADSYLADGSRSYSLADKYSADPTKSIQVDWPVKTYSIFPFEPPTPPDARPGYVPLSNDPAVFRAALETGDLRLVGPEKVDGHDTVHLTLGTVVDHHMELWVDATTFLPFRAYLTKGPGAPGAAPAGNPPNDGAPAAQPKNGTKGEGAQRQVGTAPASPPAMPNPGEPTEVWTWSWLERTPENLALMDLQPPAGFTKH